MPIDSHLPQADPFSLVPTLRIENPAVDTKPICLPPKSFFKIPHARKATVGKSWPETTNPGLIFYILVFCYEHTCVQKSTVRPDLIGLLLVPLDRPLLALQLIYVLI
jgi:hypothetical protein